MVKSDNNNTGMDSIHKVSRNEDHSKNSLSQSYKMSSTEVPVEGNSGLERRNFIQKTILGIAGLSLFPNKLFFSAGSTAPR